jgi:hypothetical protein
MADQPNVFDSGVTPPVVAPILTQDDKVATLLKSIKNENGEQKYDSLDKALEALGHSQQFIPQLKSQLTERETELARVKAELEQRESIEAVVQRLTARESTEDGNLHANVGLDEQAVRKLVEQSLVKTLTDRDVQTQYQSNVSKVQDALIAQYGDKTKEVLAEKAAALGTTPKELGDLAGRNPALVLELFKAQGVHTPNPTVRGRNVEPINPQQTEKLKRPEKSLLSGATNKERAEFMQKIKEQVHAKHGITT